MLGTVKYFSSLGQGLSTGTYHILSLPMPNKAMSTTKGPKYCLCLGYVMRPEEQVQDLCA